MAEASNAAASQLVERLVSQDLVKRTEDPPNRHTKLFRLTGKGKALIRASFAFNHFQDMLASLTSEQHQTVQAALSILAKASRMVHPVNQPKEGSHA